MPQQLLQPAAGQFGGPLGPYHGQGGWQGERGVHGADHMTSLIQ